LVISGWRSIKGHGGFVGDLAGSLVPSPEFRLVSVQAVPELAEGIRDFTCYLWTSLLRDLTTGTWQDP